MPLLYMKLYQLVVSSTKSLSMVTMTSMTWPGIHLLTLFMSLFVILWIYFLNKQHCFMTLYLFMHCIICMEYPSFFKICQNSIHSSKVKWRLLLQEVYSEISVSVAGKKILLLSIKMNCKHLFTHIPPTQLWSHLELGMCLIYLCITKT